MHIHQELYEACGECYDEDIEEVKELIAKGAPVDWRDDYYGGDTPLHAAAQEEDNGEILRLLIKNKCDVNVANKYGETPLMYAALNESMANVRILVNYLADLTIRNVKNDTAAMRAGNDAIAEYLNKEAPGVQVQ